MNDGDHVGTLDGPFGSGVFGSPMGGDSDSDSDSDDDDDSDLSSGIYSEFDYPEAWAHTSGASNRSDSYRVDDEPDIDRRNQRRKELRGNRGPSIAYNI